MFSKTGSSQRPGQETQAGAGAARAPAANVPSQGQSQTHSVPSIISQDLIIKGDLISKGELQVDGNVEGDIKGTNIVLGPTGSVSGNVNGEMVRVAGKVQGTVDAARVELDRSAKVEGDVRHDILAVAAGAHLVGKVLRRDASSAMSETKSTGESISPGAKSGVGKPQSENVKGGDGKAEGQTSDKVTTH